MIEDQKRTGNVAKHLLQPGQIKRERSGCRFRLVFFSINTVVASLFLSVEEVTLIIEDSEKTKSQQRQFKRRVDRGLEGLRLESAGV